MDFNGWAYIPEIYGDAINEICSKHWTGCNGAGCETCPLREACEGFENDTNKTDAENTRAFEAGMLDAYKKAFEPKETWRMENEKFKLFAGCLGNGTVYCNEAVEENGDYKMIAHVSDEGKVRFYVPVEHIPGDALLRIEHDADTKRQNFLSWLDAMSELEQYKYMMKRVSVSALMMTEGKPLKEKLSILKRELYGILPLCED